MERNRSFARTWTAIALATLVFPAAAAAAEAETAAKTLRKLARPHGLQIGTATQAGLILNDSTYRKHIKKQFNVVTPENEMKWANLRPSRNDYDFRGADVLVDFADENRKLVHGHTLVWHSQVPDWLANGTWTNGEITTMLEQHIDTVVGRYAGRVDTWDVVNEAVGDDGQLRDTIWSRTGKNKYIKRAFTRARRADPDAVLCYNDYNHADMEGWQKTKSNAVFKMIRKLVRKGAPIDCVGFQMHLYNGFEPTAIAENFARYGKLGVQVQITELDIRIEEPVTAGKLQTQADLYRELMEICLDAPNCTAFIMWGFTDRHSWVPSIFPGFGAATIMDEDYGKKPAFRALAKALQ